MYKEIESCRGCGNSHLRELLNLGQMELAGHFPEKHERVQSSPLVLVQCDKQETPDSCGMVQLKHSYSASEMYGENYGYRSSLNESMVSHLRNRLERLKEFTSPTGDEVVLDIGSNDATLLKMWNPTLTRVGIDPTSEKFKEYYSENMTRIPSFFNADTFLTASRGKKAKAITSIAMFYDLERPLDFVKDIASILDDEGAWLFEQSYLVTMCEKTSYDTICQEHLEYYSLSTIRWFLNRTDLVIVDVELTAANGGSISIIAKNKRHAEESPLVQKMIDQEEALFSKKNDLLVQFSKNVHSHIEKLKETISQLKRDGYRVWGLGASTKGNIILQACGLNSDMIDGIIEVNSDKFGKYTPGTRIPILSENEINFGPKDVLFVLPWHFRSFFDKKMRELVNCANVKLLYPLPEIEIVRNL